MATTRQRVDKDTFKQIFRDYWGPFQQGHPRYQERHVQAVIDKMLGCGTPESGYTAYLCLPKVCGKPDQLVKILSGGRRSTRFKSRALKIPSKGHF
jgi:hypothetical protein